MNNLFFGLGTYIGWSVAALIFVLTLDGILTSQLTQEQYSKIQTWLIIAGVALASSIACATIFLIISSLYILVVEWIL